jgi:hypothetical protein
MIHDVGGKKRLLAFRAFIAATTVQAAVRSDAGKTQMQRK